MRLLVNYMPLVNKCDSNLGGQYRRDADYLDYVYQHFVSERHVRTLFILYLFNTSR